MTPDQIAMVEKSFAQIVPVKGLAAEMFYARLFTIAPHTQPMFKGEMKAQGEKLMTTLAAVVAGLRDLDALLPVARDLAARHVTYGVTPSDYEPVGQALIFTLRQSLGEAFTPEVEAAWKSAYLTLSRAMVDSAYPRAAEAVGTAAE